MAPAARRSLHARALRRCLSKPEFVSGDALSASINGGFDKKGFPIGVQIVGRRFDDIGVLGMAKAFEGLRGPQKPWPSPPKK